MKRKKTYKIPHRRVREGRTNYRKRLKLLSSGKPRFVIRRSANSFLCQIVQHDPKGDKTVVTINNKNLKELGWKAHGGNIPAAYLTGFVCGTEAKKKGISQAVTDIGLQLSSRGSRLYAALKGAVDAGLKVSHSPEILPSEERITGKHISSYAVNLKKEDPEKYKKVFSAYLKNKLPPEELVKHFEEVKAKIK